VTYIENLVTNNIFTQKLIIGQSNVTGLTDEFSAARDYAEAQADGAKAHADGLSTADRDALALRLGYTGSTGVSPWQDMVAKAEAGQTIISGGYIRTALIRVGNDTLISGDYIQTKYIKANELTVQKLVASQGNFTCKINNEDGISITQGASELFRVAPNGQMSLSKPFRYEAITTGDFPISKDYDVKYSSDGAWVYRTYYLTGKGTIKLNAIRSTMGSYPRTLWTDTSVVQYYDEIQGIWISAAKYNDSGPMFRVDLARVLYNSIQVRSYISGTTLAGGALSFAVSDYWYHQFFFTANEPYGVLINGG
jgi:hypothetical protein